MREALAERLLAEVMRWSPENVAEERPILQALATYKYDQYQQYSPGMHFIESLAMWLSKFQSDAEKRTAYQFVKDHLIFISESEMRHLVAQGYPDVIQHFLISKVAQQLGEPDYLVSKILSSDAFQKAQRKSLFLGLSDGARVDVFRRMAGLNNEQVYATYQISLDKGIEMVEELRNDLTQLDPRSSSKDGFNTLVLLDDFSGSGDSLLRQEDGIFKGKIVKCLKTLKDINEKAELLEMDSLTVYVVLYIATRRAMDALKQRSESEEWPASLPRCDISSVYVLESDIEVTQERCPDFDNLLGAYYDGTIMDKHLKKGGPDVVHGYAGCSLPLVLSHNTPNNSVYLLWAHKPNLRTAGLFPRVSRHREEP